MAKTADRALGRAPQTAASNSLRAKESKHFGDNQAKKVTATGAAAIGALAGPVGWAVGGAVAAQQAYSSKKSSQKQWSAHASARAMDVTVANGRSRGFEQANHQYMAQHAQDHSTASSNPSGATGGTRGFANQNNQAAAQKARGHRYIPGGVE